MKQRKWLLKCKLRCVIAPFDEKRNENSLNYFITITIQVMSPFLFNFELYPRKRFLARWKIYYHVMEFQQWFKNNFLFNLLKLFFVKFPSDLKSYKFLRNIVYSSFIYSKSHRIRIADIWFPVTLCCNWLWICNYQRYSSFNVNSITHSLIPRILSVLYSFNNHTYAKLTEFGYPLL